MMTRRIFIFLLLSSSLPLFAQTTNLQTYNMDNLFIGSSSQFKTIVGASLIYPDSLRQQGVAGKVLAKITIDTNARIKAVDILVSPDQRLSDIYRKALMKTEGHWNVNIVNRQKTEYYFIREVVFKP